MEFRSYLDQDSDIWLDCMHWLLYTFDWDLSTLSNLIWKLNYPRCAATQWLQWQWTLGGLILTHLSLLPTCCALQRCVYTRVYPNVLDTLLSCLVRPIPPGRPWQVVARNISRTGELLDPKPGGASAFLSWFTVPGKIKWYQAAPCQTRFAAVKRRTEVTDTQ